MTRRHQTTCSWSRCNGAWAANLWVTSDPGLDPSVVATEFSLTDGTICAMSEAPLSLPESGDETSRSRRQGAAAPVLIWLKRPFLFDGRTKRIVTPCRRSPAAYRRILHGHIIAKSVLELVSGDSIAKLR